MNASEVVATTLKQHRDRHPFQSPPACCCGWVNRQYGINDSTDHAGHVAEAVVEALGLAEQWGVVTEDVFVDETPDDYADDQQHAEELAAERCQSCDHCRNSLPKHVVRRYTTQWVAVSGIAP